MISIVSLVKNERRHLLRSLPVLRQQRIETAFELIYIDSGSTDGTVELIREHAREDARLRLVQIPPEAFHHARTRNLGAELAGGRRVCFLGGDAVPLDTGWLRNLVQPLSPEAGVAASYGRQVPREDADIGNICRMTFNYGPHPRTQHVAGGSAKERYFFSSVNCCIDRDLAGTGRLFDEAVPVDEDVTLARRIIDGNRKIVYCADAAVEHSHNYGYWEILQRYFDNAVVYRKIGAFADSGNRIGSDGWKYVRHCARTVVGRPRSDWARVAGFLFCSSLGLALGARAGWLPAQLRSKLSKYGTCDPGTMQAAPGLGSLSDPAV